MAIARVVVSMDGMVVGPMLICALRKALQGQADSEKATAMQAYLKSSMPYYGIQAAEQRAIFREAFARWWFVQQALKPVPT